LANTILTQNAPESPSEPAPELPRIKGTGPCWGYRASDSEEGWEGAIFPDRAAATAAGYPADSPHEFVLARQKEREQEALAASKRAAAKMGVRQK
jgi:hypothetical protein